MAPGGFEIPESEKQKQTEYSSLARSIIENRFAEKPKAFVHTYGCQGNVAEGERLKGILEQIGYGLTDDVTEADLVLYNTCAVREHAEDRVFGNVGALKSLKAQNRDMRIFLCGCMVQQPHIAEKFYKSYPFVDVIFGTNAIHRLPEFLYRSLSSGRRIVEIPGGDGFITEDIPVKRDSSFKAWLPVMYGCNNFCTYCIVPYVRGRERSRDPQKILEEARSLIRDGYKEITLLGQNVNSYGKNPDMGYNFARLLREINDIEGDFIIRFMTSHPKDCTRELLETIAQCEKVAKHLHLPFQSGSDRILKLMNRGYTSQQYLELVDTAYSLIPDLSITADVIVGFPGETYEDFEMTKKLVEKAGFTSMFTFIYSPREGTKAASMDDPVSAEEKGRWFRELLEVQERIAAERTARCVGKTYRALCEGTAKSGNIEARTSGNFIIEIPAGTGLTGTFRDIKVTAAKTWMLSGEII